MNFIPSLGECTNPLIRFDPIKGLAVGLFNAYPLLPRPIKRGPLLVILNHDWGYTRRMKGSSTMP